MGSICSYSVGLVAQLGVAGGKQIRCHVLCPTGQQVPVWMRVGTDSWGKDLFVILSLHVSDSYKLTCLLRLCGACSIVMAFYLFY